jgi:hypothetical protein
VSARNQPLLPLPINKHALTSYLTSERASDGQLACQLHAPSGSRCQCEPRSELRLVCRGLHRRPSVRLPTRRGLYATVLPEDNTETVVQEGWEPRNGSVSCPPLPPFDYLRAQDETFFLGGTTLTRRGTILTRKARRSRRTLTPTTISFYFISLFPISLEFSRCREHGTQFIYRVT